MNDLAAIVNTARVLMSNPKGLLAMDESTPTCNKRFAKYGIAQTPEMRRDYRELIVTTPGLSQFISGAILYDETVRQYSESGRSLLKLIIETGIIPGIKVDSGAVDLAGFPGEKITEGLDGLRERLGNYAGMGLRFAKWRAVIKIENGIPTNSCIKANNHALARYAALCQEAGLLPIVEPEVLMDGSHSMQECGEVTESVLKDLFFQLYKERVNIEGIILKPNMVLPGLDNAVQNGVDDVAEATVNCLRRCVPAAVAGVAFLSGGQPGKLASSRLNLMHSKFRSTLPWPLTFSFSRTIQLPALEIWKGKDANKSEAQKMLLYQAQCNSQARRGIYSDTL